MPEKQTNAAPAAPEVATREGSAPQARRLPVIAGPIVIAIILVLFWLPQMVTHAAATVNGQSISQSELDRRVGFERVWNQWVGNTIPTSGPEAATFKTQVLDMMVENVLVMQEAKKVGVTATTSDVSSSVTTLASQLGMTEAQMTADLTKAGLSRQTLENILREDAIVNRYFTTIVAATGTDEEKQTAISNWYNDEKAKANIVKNISSGGAKVGQAAPDFTLNGLDGKPVKLSDYKGQAVLINFWATWCNPCRQEMPDLEALWKTYKDRGVVVLAVNLTDQDTVSDVTQYIKDLALTFPVVLDETGSVSSLYRVGPIPSSYFVDRQGVLSAVQVGSMSRATMDQRLAKVQ